MRTRLDDLVRARLESGAAVPALTCYDYTTALGVVSAAEEFGEGVVLLVTPKTAAHRDGLRLVAALRQLADAATVPVVVQLDHAASLSTILAAVASGADAVLADGSLLPPADNAAFVAQVRSLTDALGVVVEGELGSIEGDEDKAFAVQGGPRTDPALVAPFLEHSGAHLLATSVGNVHGNYVGEPMLDWPLIELIRGHSAVPLTLHGASGLSDADLARAARAGLGKVNINTELRAANLAAAQGQLDGSISDGHNVMDFEKAWRAASYTFALGALARLSPARPHELSSR